MMTVETLVEAIHNGYVAIHFAQETATSPEAAEATNPRDRS